MCYYGQILRCDDIAIILQISEDAVRKMFQRGDLPQRKLAGKWVITRGELLRLAGHEPRPCSCHLRGEEARAGET